MANEMDRYICNDYVEDCIKNIEKRANDMVNKTIAAQTDLIRQVKERQRRDRTVIEDRFRRGLKRTNSTNSPAVFRPGTTNLDCIKDLFGDILLSFENETCPWKKIKTFEFDQLSLVNNIMPLIGGGAWICDDANSFIQISARGDITSRLSLDFQVEHAAIHGQDFLASSLELLAVKRLAATGLVKTAMSTSPLFPLGIHVTQDGDICVCYVDKFEFSLTTKSRRFVMIYHHIGLLPTTIEYEKGNRIFTFPNRVTSNKKNIIAVDIQSKTKGRIVCVTRDCRVLFEYIRQGVKTFCPTDICSTSDSKLFVLDESSQDIVVLSTDGMLISTICLADFGIAQAMVMAVDCHNDRLWIGYSLNKVSLFSIGNERESGNTDSDDTEVTNNKTEDTWF